MVMKKYKFFSAFVIFSLNKDIIKEAQKSEEFSMRKHNKEVEKEEENTKKSVTAKFYNRHA